MKLGITYTYTENCAENLKRLASLGVEAIDLNLMDTSTDFYSADTKSASELVSEIKSAAKSSGIFISQTHGPWTWPPDMDSTAENRIIRLSQMSRAVELTAELGCKACVIHPIMPFGVEDVLCKKEKETFDLNLWFFGELAKTAEQHNVTVCIENMPMPNFSIATPEKILQLIAAVASPNIAACLDTGHVTMHAGLTAASSVRLLGNKLRVLHVHDNDGKGDFHWFPKSGVTDWSAFAAALGEIGFDGAFSLETLPNAKLPPEEYDKTLERLIGIAKEIIA